MESRHNRFSQIVCCTGLFKIVNNNCLVYRRSREHHQQVAYKYVTGAINGFYLCHPVAANVVIDRTLKCRIFRSHFRRLVVVTSAQTWIQDFLIQDQDQDFDVQDRDRDSRLTRPILEVHD